MKLDQLSKFALKLSLFWICVAILSHFSVLSASVITLYALFIFTRSLF